MIEVPYDGVKDFQFIGMVDNSANMLVVNPAVKANNLKELIALAKARPGGLSYGTAGVGSSPYIDGEAFKLAAGIDMAHVPYKGAAPALTDLVAGHIQVGLSNTSAVQPYVQSGQLRALAYASNSRSRAMPGVPTFAEQGVPQVNSGSWRVLAAPAGTPKAVVDRLVQALAQVQSDPAFQKQLRDQGSDVFRLDPAKTTAYIRDDAARTTKLLATLGVLKK
jgi:tripartite-type tricarboxylate transporter receptor subunit TctC